MIVIVSLICPEKHLVAPEGKYQSGAVIPSSRDAAAIFWSNFPAHGPEEHEEGSGWSTGYPFPGKPVSRFIGHRLTSTVADCCVR